MSSCIFIASDVPLTEYAPLKEYSVTVDIDKGIIDDGGADDNYRLLAFDCVKDYSGREYGVSLDWEYTDGRAIKILEYIKAALQNADRIEIWKVWLMDYYEYDERPFTHRKEISADGLTAEHLKEINDAVIWNTPDKMYPDRPSFYCLTVTR